MRIQCNEGAAIASRTITFYLLLCKFYRARTKGCYDFPLAVFSDLVGTLALATRLFGSFNFFYYPIFFAARFSGDTCRTPKAVNGQPISSAISVKTKTLPAIKWSYMLITEAQ